MASNSIFYGGCFRKIGGVKVYCMALRVGEMSYVTEGNTVKNAYKVFVGEAMGVAVYVITQKRGRISSHWEYKGKTYKSDIALLRNIG